MRIYSSPIKSVKCTLNFSFKLLIFSSIPQKDRIVYGRPLHSWRALNEILSWCMPAKRRPPISVLGVLTKDGWDHRQKESRNLYQTQTIGDIISWMSFRRNRQAGHTPDDYPPRKCLKDLHEEHSVSVINDGDTIKSFCSKYNVDEKHVITYINRALKILIPEKTFEHEKMGNERGKRRNRHTRTSNGTAPLLRAVRSKS